ncbi:hypothetical protein GYB22_04570 [bacterium]|nr:hypothetical protein [bacterium]
MKPSEQSPEERKAYLAALNQIASYTASILEGEEVSKTRIKQYKKYFRKTHNMLLRLARKQGEINNNSFKYGYGGKVLVRKVMLQLGIIKQNELYDGRATYTLLVAPQEIDFDLVSRIIVEVYLIRNKVESF